MKANRGCARGAKPVDVRPSAQSAAGTAVTIIDGHFLAHDRTPSDVPLRQVRLDHSVAREKVATGIWKGASQISPCASKSQERARN